MSFMILICVVCFVSYTQARSVETLKDVANINIENFKGEAKKVSETLVQTIEILNNMKQKHVDQNKELNKNSVDLVTKMSKPSVTGNGDTKNFSPSQLFYLINCKNFTRALNKTEELLKAFGLVSITFSQSLVVISDEIDVCAQKDPYPRIFCQLGLLGTIYEQGEALEQVAANFTQYAVASVKTIVADVVSCFDHPKNQTFEGISDGTVWRN